VKYPFKFAHTLWNAGKSQRKLETHARAHTHTHTHTALGYHAPKWFQQDYY